MFQSTTMYPSVGEKSSDDEKKKIPKLGQQRGVYSQTMTQSSIKFEPNSDIKFTNYPCLTWVYTDHELKSDFVCVAVAALSGSRDINFTLSEDGMTLMLNYVWPSVMVTPKELFPEEMTREENLWTLNHPKIHALMSHLLDRGITEKSRPQGRISIRLPRQVQHDLNTWKKREVNGEKIFLLEFETIFYGPWLKSKLDL